jgi:Zn-dependent peptidase ImmA (M78 family)
LDYGKYKNARNASWQCLIDFNINKLPVMVTDIIANSGTIKLLKNSDVDVLLDGESGKTVCENGYFNIIYRDTESSKRCRFTIAHELGHIFLGHLMINTSQYRTFKIQNDTESQANVFARDLLAPACVLHELQALSAAEISKLCNISLDSATFRAERMRELELRNAWYLHPLERKVREQFDDFIKNKKAER